MQHHKGCWLSPDHCSCCCFSATYQDETSVVVYRRFVAGHFVGRWIFSNEASRYKNPTTYRTTTYQHAGATSRTTTSNLSNLDGPRLWRSQWHGRSIRLHQPYVLRFPQCFLRRYAHPWNTFSGELFFLKYMVQRIWTKTSSLWNKNVKIHRCLLGASRGILKLKF